MSTLAPIALFVYNRPRSLQMTLNYLQNNTRAAESELYIFSEGAKDKQDQKKVDQVRAILDTLSGFKAIHRSTAAKNQGLRHSLITGITAVLTHHSRVIVLEDDIATSPYFLEYMNTSLEHYQNTPKVWTINASMGAPPALLDKIDYPHTTYCIYRNSSHGWGTWKDRWEKAQWDISPLALADPKVATRFNRGGEDLTPMLIHHFRGKIDSWAVLWSYNISRQGGLCLSPRYPYAAHRQQEPGTHIVGTVAHAQELYQQRTAITYPPTTAVISDIARAVAQQFSNEIPYLLQSPEQQARHPIHRHYTAEFPPLPPSTSPYRVGLFVNTDILGSGLAAKRLHEGLLHHGVNAVRILNRLTEPAVATYNYPGSLQIPPILPDLNCNMLLHEHPFATTGMGPAEIRNIARDFDIINLHRIVQSLSLEAIAELAQMHIPLVWTTHSYNPLTGGCDFPGSCKGYQQDCHHCPQLRRHRQYPKAVLQLKQRYFTPEMVIVTLNQAMQQEVQQSAVFSRNRVEVIPNGVDTELFHPIPRREARQQLQLPLDQPIVAFIAASLTNPRKGGSALLAALRKIPPSSRPHLLTAGEPMPPAYLQGIAHTQRGLLSDAAPLCRLYAAADVVAIPSLEDNLPNVMLESLACGTPVVGFRTGGIPDVIQDGKQGYVVERGDVDMLAQRMLQTLNGPDLSAQCRQHILDHYTLQHPAKRYHELFTELWEQRRQHPRSTTPTVNIPRFFPELTKILPFRTPPSRVAIRMQLLKHVLRVLVQDPRRFRSKLIKKLRRKILRIFGPRQ